MQEIFKLTSASPDLESSLRLVLALSDAVFEPAKPSKYSSLDHWNAKLALPGAFILFTKDQSFDQPSAFVFALPTVYRELGKEMMHVWMAGVLPDARGSGQFRKLMQAVANHSRGSMLDLSVCTVPGMYPEMFRILLKHGWKIVAVRSEGKILLSRAICC